MEILRSTAVLVTLVTCSCAGNDGVTGSDADQPPAEWTEDQRDAEMERRIDARRQLANKEPERKPTKDSARITGEVPEKLLDAIKADLAERLGADTADLHPIQAEYVDWNDGSLGCPKPGEVYPQAITPGYRIVFEVGDTYYDYRAERNGYFMLCELPTATPQGLKIR